MFKINIQAASSKDLIFNINRGITQFVNKKLNIVAHKIVGQLRETIKQSLFDQPEVQSLSNGRLEAEIGLSDGRKHIEEIINVWVNGIHVKQTKARIVKDQVKASLTIYMIRRDFNDVINHPYAFVYNKGQKLPWLLWLLTYGDQIIIRDFDVSFNRQHLSHGKSRSGQAVMIRKPGGGWRIPPEFSGTRNNNFLTRALDDAENDIIDIISLNLNNTFK